MRQRVEAARALQQRRGFYNGRIPSPQNLWDGIEPTAGCWRCRRGYAAVLRFKRDRDHVTFDRSFFPMVGVEQKHGDGLACQNESPNFSGEQQRVRDVDDWEER